MKKCNKRRIKFLTYLPLPIDKFKYDSQMSSMILFYFEIYFFFKYWKLNKIKYYEKSLNYPD